MGSTKPTWIVTKIYKTEETVLNPSLTSEDFLSLLDQEEPPTIHLCAAIIRHEKVNLLVAQKILHQHPTLAYYAIPNKALTAEDIKALYLNGFIPPALTYQIGESRAELLPELANELVNENSILVDYYLAITKNVNQDIKDVVKARTKGAFTP